MFEALACGVALLCSPWNDAENLFHPGDDYLIARNGKEMTDLIQALLGDQQARRPQIGSHGLKTVRERHTCAHRAEQLMSIYEEIAA